MNATSFVTLKTSTQKCTNHLGRAVAPSGLPAPNEAASRICPDVRLADAWEGKGFRHPRIVERRMPVLERVSELPEVYYRLLRIVFKVQHNF